MCLRENIQTFILNYSVTITVLVWLPKQKVLNQIDPRSKMETPRVDCDNCEKTYKTKSSLMNHVKRIHKDLTEAVSEMLSPLAQNAAALFQKDDETLREAPKEDETPKENETEDETPKEDENPKEDGAPKEDDTPKEVETMSETVSVDKVSENDGNEFPEDAAINEVIEDLDLMEATEDAEKSVEQKTKRKLEIEQLRLPLLEKPVAINPNQNWMNKTMPVGDLLVMLDETEGEAKKAKKIEKKKCEVEIENRQNRELEKANEELQKKINEWIDECRKQKEVIKHLEKGLGKKDEEIEVKKKVIKKLKLELIKIKDDKKSPKKAVVEPAEAVRPKEKNKATVVSDKREEFPCTKCDKKESSKSDLMIHMDLRHREQEEQVSDSEKCRNGPDCSWLRNQKCKFKHETKPEVEGHQRGNHRSQAEECTNGPECNFRRRGICKFSHHQESNHGEWQEPQRQRGFRRHQGREHSEEEPRSRKGNVKNPGEPVAWCLQGDKCTKGRECMQKHTYWQQDNLKSFLEVARTIRN